jgi:hypothetical protein
LSEPGRPLIVVLVKPAGRISERQVFHGIVEDRKGEAMARPAPIPPDLDDDDDEIEATPEDLAPPPRGEENAPAPRSQAKSASDLPKPGAGPQPAPAAGNIPPDPAGSIPTMAPELVVLPRAPRAAGRRRRHDLSSILYLIALALFAAALSAAVVLVLF